MLRFIVRIFLLGLLISPLIVQTAQAFTIRHIYIKGLQGISRDAVLSYLPVRVGQSFNASQSSAIIDSLYATGFFNDVRLAEQGDALIISVTERPTIGEVDISGNKEIPKDKLQEILKQIGLVQGQLFDRATLDRFIAQLRVQYDNMGKYSATVTPTITPQGKSRVAIHIVISEGLTVEVADVSIIGNHVFSERQLRAALPISSWHFWSFFTNSDHYSESQLSASLEALQSYYMDRGYLKIKVDSTQVALTPDRKSAYLIIHITEGPLYKLSGYQMTGNTLLTQGKLAKLLQPLQKGQAFSREKVVAVEKGIKEILGDFGYIFATVNTAPEIDEANKTVFLTFYVDPGNRVYVRHINISGNIKTQDEVFRRLLRQQEASVVSQSDLKESIRQLNLSQFLEGDPNLTTVPIEGYTDQVDLDININEAHAAQALFSLGYGSNGPVVGATLNQNNVFGTGNQLGLNFNNTRAATIYSISYNNPYYTLNGVQRGYHIFYQRSTPSNLNTTTYSTNAYGADLHYAIPFDAKGDTLDLDGLLQKTQINLPSTGLSAEVQQFVNQHGTQFNQFLATVGWSRNSLDRIVFPTRGINQNANLQLALPVGGKPLNYYMMNYLGAGFYPLTSTSRFILEGHLALGYGNGFSSTTGLPFFANYYAGGIGVPGQVRGYETNSLGPRDTNGFPLGGNIMTVGSLALIVPNPISNDKVRTSIFIDAGNIYSSLGVTQPGNPRGGTPSGPLRYSTGIDVDWRIPVFNVTLSFSLAKAINAKPGDQTQVFQFNIGTGLF